MIYPCCGRILTHLADGQVCILKARPITICKRVLRVAACKRTGVYALMTHSGRILAGFKDCNCPEDITDLIPEAHREELLGSKRSNNIEILLSARSYASSLSTLAIKTRTSISFIDIGDRVASDTGKVRATYLGTEVFSSGIDTFGFDSWYAAVQTSSNLHLIKVGFRNIMAWYVSREVKPLLTCYKTENIQQIVCANERIFLLKQNGTVSMIHSDMAGQVEIFSKEPVTKIIADWPHIFFITTKGLCYYLNYNVSECNSPRLIRALECYHIENIFIAEKQVIFQYDGGRLCSLVLAFREFEYTTEIDPLYMAPFAHPYLLPFGEDMGIISVESMGSYVAFTTYEGRVYLALAQNLESQPLTEIQFFVENPLMIRDRVTAIKSAGSDPRDA